MFGMSNGAPPDKRKTKPAAEEKTAASAMPKAAPGDAIEVSVVLTPAQADKLHRLDPGADRQGQGAETKLTQ